MNCLYRLFIVYCTLIATITTSCKKLVEATLPVTSTTGGNVFTSDATASAALLGVYTNISNGNNSFATGMNSISMLSGLSADELTLFGGASNSNTFLKEFYLNALNNKSFTPWEGFYKYILEANAAIEGLSKSTSLTPAVKNQLLGEAKFLRAFINFYLVNLYGDIPLIVTSDYRVNATLYRTPKNEVYQQIVTDLLEAQSNFSNSYVGADAMTQTSERLRPNKCTATALLARVYCYIGEWAKAEIQASNVINNTGLYGLVALNDVFIKSSNEAIWQLQPVNKGWNTEDAKVFIVPSWGPDEWSNPVYISSSLLNVFEPNDERRTNWIDSVNTGTDLYYYPFKYKINTEGDPVNEYLMVFRLGEQYLIRAEARARQNKITEAQNDLNAIRARAGLGITLANDQPSLLAAIMHDRQVELFSEWGHRWLDLKRTNTIDAVMGNPGNVCAYKGGVWNTNWQLYPVPLDDIRVNSNLLPNNAGY